MDSYSFKTRYCPGSFYLATRMLTIGLLRCPLIGAGKIEAVPFAVANGFPREILLLSILAFVSEVVNARACATLHRVLMNLTVSYP